MRFRNNDIEKRAPKYLVIMYRKINGIYTVIDKIKVNIKDQKFIYKGSDFVNFDLNNPMFCDKDHYFYGFDYDTKEQFGISGKALPKGISLEQIDRYVNRGLIRQLVQGIEKPKSEKSQWIMFIIGCVCGGFGGFIIAQSVTGVVAQIIGSLI